MDRNKGSDYMGSDYTWTRIRVVIIWVVITHGQEYG